MVCLCNLESIVVASIDGNVTEVRALATAVGSPSSIHGCGLLSLKENTRPPGHLSLLAVDNGQLWIADGCLRILAVSLSPLDKVLVGT